MTIYDNEEWYDIPPTIESYYRDRFNQCGCDNKKCILDASASQHGKPTGYVDGNCRCDDCRQAMQETKRKGVAKGMDEDDPRHGTLNAYNNFKCRCDSCKETASQYYKDVKAKNLSEDDPRHGSVYAYTRLGCRCTPCKSNYATHVRERRKRMQMASKYYSSTDDQDFGISKREQSEMVGRAMGEHIWDQMEDILAPGGFRLQQQQHTISEFEKRFPNHPIKIEEDDDPYVSHKVGDWEGRYYNGPYIDMHHKKYGVQDCIHVGYDGDESKGNLHKLTENEFHNNIKNWISEYGPDYLAQYEPRPKRSSKWYLASEKVMPSSENNPWEMIPQDPDNIGPSPVNVDNSPCKCPDDRCKLTVDDPKHGTITGYSNKCKCRPCRDISLMYNRKTRGIDLDAPIIPLVDQQNVLNMIPKENIFNDPNDPRHGTATGYQIDCRCDPCKNAKSEYHKEYFLDKLEEMQNDPDHEFHGTITGYTIGDRCDPCKNANMEYQKQYKLDRLQEMQNNPNHKLHGTTAGYAFGDRCDPCKNAKSEYDKQYKLNKLKEMQNDPDHEFHGTITGYQIGCRCVPCKNTNSEYGRQQYIKRKNSSMWYHESSGGTCLNCAVPLTDRMDNYCGTCQDIMAQGESQAYMQVNPNHPEARPFQKPHDFSGNE